MPGGSSLHSFTGNNNKYQLEEEEKIPGELKNLQKKEEKESQNLLSRASQVLKNTQPS